MLGVYSLIWTICHKLMWFYRNTVLFHIIFVVTHGEIFSHLCHTGPLPVNKMALPLMYRWRWRHIHAFMRVQRFAAGAYVTCLIYATDWWAVIGPVIYGESKSQASRTMWWDGWGCEVSCGGHHRLRGKTTTGSTLHGAVFDIAQILAYLVHNMSRSQLYLGFGHFGWLPSFSVKNILAGLRLNCISSVEITLFLLADILLQHRALFRC